MLCRSANRLQAAFAELGYSLTCVLQASNLSFVLYFAAMQCYLHVSAELQRTMKFMQSSRLILM